MNHKDCALIIFARAPVPGKVKTRLIPTLGEAGAAEIYESLLIETLHTASDCGIDDILLYCTPTLTDDFLQKCATDNAATLHLQCGENLGQRIYAALEDTLRSYRSVIVIGSDCPGLSVDDLNLARQKLSDDSEIVIGPAEDGGYYLIGVNTLHRELFDDIEWGGPDVLADTNERIQTLRLACYALPERWDLDRPEDLARYAKLHKTVSNCHPAV